MYLKFIPIKFCEQIVRQASNSMQKIYYGMPNFYKMENIKKEPYGTASKCLKILKFGTLGAFVHIKETV